MTEVVERALLKEKVNNPKHITPSE